MNAPCKGCPNRTVEPNCHMTCETYLAFRAERDRVIQERQATVGVVWSDESKQRASRKKLNRYKRDH